jgi:tRNA nucleotidyltransferase (CCA-adding enzyme)
MQIPLDPQIRHLAETIASAGGRAILVGGVVRDALLGIPSKDYDLEVYGLAFDALEGALGRVGRVMKVGRAFGVLRVAGIDADVALPRRDNKTGRGHRGFQVDLDPTLDFAEAARRRDLTINSIGLDPLSGELLDPHGGQRDLAARRLRATDARHFGEDPLRGLRVAQFAARFEMTADDELVALCSNLDLAELPGERLFEEFRKLLLKGRRPALGLSFLATSELLRFFPALAALRGIAQDTRWHPEGDVWTHTLLVVDAAAAERADLGEDDALALMFAALCHDLGKPQTTAVQGDRVTSHAHETEGVSATQAFLGRLRAPGDLVTRVCGLVRHHVAPAAFVRNGASARAYRRLARALGEAGVNAELLVRLARADRLGRATDEARSGRFPEGETFLERARALAVAAQPPKDAVQGRHLIARGLQPGREFKDLLARCRDVQDETGWDDPQQILDRVLGA